MDLCVKCKVKPHTINIRYAVYCNECFLEQTFHKYRMAVAKSKTTTSSGKIMVVVEAHKPSSILLSHFTQLAKLQDPNRKNLDSFEYVSFDSMEAFDGSDFGAFADRHAIKCHSYDIKSIIPEYEDVLAACPNANTKSEVTRILDEVAIILVAKQLEISTVYLGDSCSTLASTVIADTCTGRGMTLPWKLATRQLFLPAGVTVIRPLRELVDREVNHYTDLIAMDYAVPSSILAIVRSQPVDAAVEPSHDNIRSLTNGFLEDLDRENSATVSTVTRTTAKIQTAISPLLDCKEWSPCGLCLCPLSEKEVSFCFGCHQLIESTKDASFKLPSYTIDILNFAGTTNKEMNSDQ